MRKLNFKKISAVLGSVVMASATLGLAAAASFPAPFVQNGVANNVAVVYGTGTGVSASDQVQAGAIATALGGSVTGGSLNISGENVLLQQPSSYLNVGEGVQSVFDRAITKTDMPTLLADGTYRDSQNNDHDYTQKINVANLNLNSFNLEDYDSNVSTSTPAIGFNLSSGENVLNYTLTFQSPVNASQMQYTNLNLMGTSYYVLSATGGSSPSLTLLDSSASASLSQGGSTTLTVGNTTYSVSVPYVDSSGNVQFTVNGETTDTLTKGETYKLSSGAYLGVKDVLAQGYSGGTSLVQFSIGSGKIVMNSGQDVQINSNSVTGVSATIGTTGTSNYSISNITIAWDTSDTGAITPTMAATMPAFDGVKLSFSGMTYPGSENTSVANDGNTAVKLSTTIEGGAVSLDLLGMDKTSGNFTTIGKDSNNLLVTSNSKTLNNVARNNEFVVSGNSGKVAESHVYKVTSFSNTTSNGMQVTLTPQDGGNQITLTNGQGSSIGTVTGITLTPSIDYAAKTVSFTVSGTGTTFGTLYTAAGMQVALPWMNETNLTSANNGTDCNVYYPAQNNRLGYDATVTLANNTKLTCLSEPSSYNINFTETDSNGNIGNGASFQVQAGRTGSAGSYETSVTNVAGAGAGVEVGDSNVYDYTVPSAIASAVSYDQGPTQETADITYHGSQSAVSGAGQSYGKLYLASPSATVTSGGTLGNVLFTDAEKSSWQNDNVVIVGGSCINSAAASALGVSPQTCGDAFTAATNVGPGQFLIKGVSGAFSPGKLALVVAGYDAADTVNAATYLTHNTVDTSSTYIGTSGTQATMQVANATA